MANQFVDFGTEAATQKVLDDVALERNKQRSMWSRDHDDGNGPNDWAAIITHEIGDAIEAMWHWNDVEWRAALVKIAAVAVAAIEAHDRKIDEEIG